VLAQVYKLDSVEELPQMTATERVIRQWFKLSVRLAYEKKKETLIAWDSMIAVHMYRQYVQRQQIDSTDDIGVGAVKEVFKFFEWMLLSFTENDFTQESLQFWVV
jgi:hypothetical protein